ncbi:MAG TPA: T9SS type A sorting domain-containing protein [Candidatus Kapabacteria bacterium]|nr:T9SS type A sorting domain-containing protein [Candidatus Kapabacteria bacterium]
MSTSDQNLDKLFAGLRADAPVVLPNELNVLLDKGSAQPHSDPFHQITGKRKRNRIMTTGIIAALISAVAYFGITITSDQVSTSKHGRVTSPPSAIIQPLSSITQKVETQTLPIVEKDTFKVLSYSRATIMLPSVITPTDNELTSLGIKREDDGTIILDEDYTSQVEFAIDTFARFASHDSRENTIPYDLFPQFVTDVKGNLIMIGEHKLINNNSRSSSLSLIAGMVSSLPKLPYYRTEMMSARDGVVDSTVVPPMYTVHWKIGIGIMSLDTIVSYEYRSKRAQDIIYNSIVERLAAKDSLCKLRYGGESGLNATFANLPNGCETVLERRVFHVIDSIGASNSSDVQKAEAQFGYLNDVKCSVSYSEVERLKFERLSRGYDYKLYLLKHAEDEKKFAQINSYLPLLVRKASGSLPNKQYDNGLIFWYKPTDELSQAIPAIANSTLSVSESIGNGVELTANPNPATAYLFANYKTTVGQTVTIELRNLLGHTMLGPFSRSEASGSIQLDVSHLSSGMYLLIATSDKGKQQIQRIIVQKP